MSAEPRWGLAGRLASVFLRSRLTPVIVIAAILLGVVAVALTPREEEPQIVVPYDRDTTKGGHEDALPIADQLVPFLEHALSDSSSDYVFPGPDRQMLDEQTKLEEVLRRAMGRAGLVTHYEHVCRRCKHEGRPHMEKHDDAELRRCSACGLKMWPRAIPRHLRFHDLRHTTATCCSTPVSTPSPCSASCGTAAAASSVMPEKSMSTMARPWCWMKRMRVGFVTDVHASARDLISIPD